jgi:putative ABC transport system permease protein
MAGIRLLVRSAFTRRRAGSMMLMGSVIALAAAGLTAAVVLRSDAADRVDEAFSAARGPDLVLYAEPSASAGLAGVLSQDARVLRMAAPVSVVDAQLLVGDGRIDVSLRELTVEDDLDRPVLLGGRLPERDGEIALDAGLAAHDHVAVGDTVEVANGAGTFQLDVVGIAYDFTDCFYPACDPARVWTGRSTFAQASAGMDIALFVAVELDDPAHAAAVEASIGDQLGDKLLGANDWLDTRADLLVEQDFFGAFLGAFAVFVLICSGIVIGGAITARTVARRRTIGICKATGYTTFQLTAGILAEHLVIGAVATVVGATAAFVLAPHLRIGSLRILDGSSLAWSDSALVVTLAVVSAVIVIATIVPAVRAGRITATAAMSPAPPGRRTVRPSRRLLSRLPIVMQLGLRSFVVRALRTVLSISAIVVAMVAAMVSMSILRSVDNVLDHPALAGDPHDAVVVPPDDMSSAEAAELLDDVPGVASWYPLLDDHATVAAEPVHVRVMGGEPDVAGTVIGGGAPLRHAGEAIAGYGLMHERGWSVGDRIGVTIDSTLVQVTLVGWYRETEDGGAVLEIRAEDYAVARPAARFSYAVNASDGITPRQLGTELQQAFGNEARVRVDEIDGASLRPFTIALRSMMVLIAAVSGAYLLAIAITTARERAHRTGILRSVGLDHRDLTAETLTYAVAIAVVAVALGLPLGFLAERAIGDLLTEQLGVGPGITLGPTPLDVAMVALVALGVSMAAAWLSSLPSMRRPASQLIAAVE